MRTFFLLLGIGFICFSCTSDVEKIDISDGWMMGKAGEKARYPASVPGCVHLDLMGNGLIDDPFFGRNEKDVQWVGEESWVYTKTYRFDNPDLEKDNIDLVFEGLDTYADVFLNDTLILQADNMFRCWEMDVKEILKEGENKLAVVFSPPGEINEEKARQLPYQLPDNRAFSRKAPYHFGWDWGPELITCGIWKPVYFRAWNGFRINNVHITHEKIDRNPLPLSISLCIESDIEAEVRVMVFDDADDTRVGFEKLSLQKGINNFRLEAELEDPELWWPAGLGKQVLYNFRVKVIGKGISDEMNIRFGIRDIELVQEPDDFGESFFFRVNGLPVFMKGANYIPQDNFLPSVDTTRYENLFQSVLDANMNMLRVWGGGFYENDLFYDLCDENGILIWQDFMFACNMYPGDSAFLENVKQEAIDNVSRLSNHPCIALWCGNNEIDEGWHNWGWVSSLGYSQEDSIRVWHDYDTLFHHILPEVVEEVDPGTIYHPSSPATGWGREEAYTSGDVHYWGVWWGEEAFDIYREKVGRFVSEYGFQGMPPMETIESFGGVSCPRTSSAVPHPRILEAHQKHPRGTQLIQQYMERDYVVPEDFEDYVYISQVLQAEGMAEAFLSHRISPKCMGTLYWQLNDCWPVTSWSGLDYYGRWKGLHYHVKRAYQPLMITTTGDHGRNEVHVVNDFPHEVSIKSVLYRYSVDTVIGDPIVNDLKIPALSKQLVKRFPDPNENRSRLFIKAELIVDNEVVSRSFHYFVPTKKLDLQEPGLNYEVMDGPAGPKIILKTKKLARQVFLEARGLEGHFSDNFFDMAPGETRELIFLGESDAGELNEKLKIRSIYDTYH